MDIQYHNILKDTDLDNDAAACENQSKEVRESRHLHSLRLSD